jgi:glycosyltransferase involved in cell wall biosynthesis
MSKSMPRIYFTSSTCIDEGSGAAVHTRGICFGLAKLTEVVPLVAYCKDNTLSKVSQAGMSTRYLVRTKTSPDGSVSPWRRLKYTFKFFVHIAGILLTRRGSNNVFYIRWTYFSFPLIALIIILRAKYFLEENTKDGPEQLSMGRIFRARICGFLENIAIRYAKGVFCVTDEISRYICERYSYPAYKTRIVPNGVEPGITASNSPDDDLRAKLGLKASSDFLIGFMGKAGYPWHGIEEMCQLVRNLDDDAVHLVIFGLNATERNIPRVHFVGYIDEARLYPWLRSLNMAFGTMNLQIKGLTQACPIKLGIYLDAGLPVVINYDDVRFTREEPFVLNLSKLDRTQWSARLENFIKRVRMDSKRLRQSAQEFAHSRLSWNVMAEHTLDFIVSSMNAKNL